MDINKTQALQDLQKALLSINGASRRLGISTNEVVIILPRHDFSYFKNVLESGSGSLTNTLNCVLTSIGTKQQVSIE